MKKNSLALIAAGVTVSLGAFAAVPTETQPFQLVVPNLQSGIEITLEGLYLRPSNSDLDYGTVQSVASDDSFTSTTNNFQTIDPNYNLGFRVGLGYIFPNSGNDVQVAWTHFNHSTSDTTNLDDGMFTTPSGRAFLVDNRLTALERIEALLYSDFTDSIYQSATVVGDAKFKLDSIDLNVGQYMDIGTRFRMRLFGGLRFAQVTNDQSTTLSASANIYEGEPGNSAEVDFSAEALEQFNSTFSGVGPQLGIETNYHIGNGFGVAAHSAVALLVGNVKSGSSVSYNADNFGEVVESWEDGYFLIHNVSVQSASDPNFNSNDAARIVPALDAKLGLNWSHAFGNQSVLTLEGGYQWTQYIDAVDKLTPVNDQDAVVRTTSSVGFDGPYLALNWSV